MRRVVIGLGTNLGDRIANFDTAIARLRADSELGFVARSPIYESEPAGGPPQGNYLNAAVLLVTSTSADEILRRTLAIEAALGRDRSKEVRWGPRTLDLDLLWIEGELVAIEGLTVPHPRLAERVFAVRPLVDVVPDARDPRSGVLYASLPVASAPIPML